MYCLYLRLSATYNSHLRPGYQVRQNFLCFVGHNTSLLTYFSVTVNQSTFQLNTQSSLQKSFWQRKCAVRDKLNTRNPCWPICMYHHFHVYSNWKDSQTWNIIIYCLSFWYRFACMYTATNPHGNIFSRKIHYHVQLVCNEYLTLHFFIASANTEL